MHNADDFDHAVGPDAVDDNMPRMSDAQFARNQTSPLPQRVDTDSWTSVHGPGA